MRLVPAALAGLNPAVSVLTRAAAGVVLVCTHNSARSQLAAALWNQHGRHRAPVPAASAGTDPSPRVHPRARSTSPRATTCPWTPPAPPTSAMCCSPATW
ncbi:hypothetical protein [Actinomadura vinacea]|uniref:arsenate-mycothiol transferase ArsC n=1 Tax=Actinomadura vinacea TaxID=115336 RepID=UPI0031D7BF00